MEKYDFYQSVKDIKKNSKDIMNGSWGFCASKTTLVMALSLLFVGLIVLVSFLTKQWYYIVLTSIFSGIMIYLLSYGYQIFCYNLASNMSAKTADLFSGFGKVSIKLIRILIMKIFIWIFGLILLVFMGFKFELSYSMSSIVLYEDKKLKAGKVLKQSKRLMNENCKRFAKLRLSNFGWFLLSLTIVGALWAAPYLFVSKSVFYNDLKTDF